MSVTIRLAKIGKKFAPAYKIVVANTRDKRNGRFLDILGHYNPSEGEEKLVVDKKKLQEWQEKGAITTKAVESLVAGKYEFKSYNPKAAKAKAAEAAAELKSEAVEKVDTKTSAETPSETGGIIEEPTEVVDTTEPEENNSENSEE